MSINRFQTLINKSPILTPIQSSINIQNDINLQNTDDLLLTVDWISIGKYIFYRDNKMLFIKEKVIQDIKKIKIIQ